MRWQHTSQFLGKLHVHTANKSPAHSIRQYICYYKCSKDESSALQITTGEKLEQWDFHKYLHSKFATRFVLGLFIAYIV